MKHALIALALVASQSHAAFISGNELLDDLNNPNAVHQLAALRYIQGAIDVGQGVAFCAPETLSGRQAMDIVKQALVANPASRHIAAGDFVVYVMQEFFPCKKKGNAL